MVSSFERTLGQELLADELAALCYWLIEDTQRKGYFEFQELKPLLEAFRFDVSPFSLNQFRKEFKFLLSQNPREIRHDANEEEVVIRFDLVR